MNSIKVGPITYAVIEQTNPTHEKARMDGYISYTGTTITVRKGLAPQCKRQTMWHEVLHAILTQAGVPEHNEAYLDALAYGIVGVLEDNAEMRSQPDERTGF